jgi:hypothetical protein
MPIRFGLLRPALHLVACSLAALAGSSPARADVPGTVALLSHYSVIALDDLSTTSDVEGRTFVGDDVVSTSSATFAIAIAPPPAESTRTGAGTRDGLFEVELIPAPAVAPTREDTSDFEVELAAGYRVRFAKDLSNEALTRLLDALESRR